MRPPLGIIHLARAQNFPKTYISYPLINTRSCEYQGVRNISLWKIFANVLNEWSIRALGRGEVKADCQSNILTTITENIKESQNLGNYIYQISETRFTFTIFQTTQMQTKSGYIFNPFQVMTILHWVQRWTNELQNIFENKQTLRITQGNV